MTKPLELDDTNVYGKQWDMIFIEKEIMSILANLVKGRRYRKKKMKFLYEIYFQENRNFPGRKM